MSAYASQQPPQHNTFSMQSGMYGPQGGYGHHSQHTQTTHHNRFQQQRASSSSPSDATYADHDHSSMISIEDGFGAEAHMRDMDLKADLFFSKYQNALPFASRLLLVASFLEDGVDVR